MYAYMKGFNSMGKLTGLQRLGVSTLLIDIKVHGNIDITKGGWIKFHNMETLQMCSMEIHSYSGKTFMISLKIDERIDDSITYVFNYDATDKLFQIIDLDDKSPLPWERGNDA